MMMMNEMWVKMPKSRNSYLKLMTGRVPALGIGHASHGHTMVG